MTTLHPEAITSPLLDQAVDLITLVGWPAFSLKDLAHKAEVPISQVYTLYPDKQNILDALMTRVDRITLDSLDREDHLEPRREKLFDLFMNRFEAMAPIREVIRSAWNNALFDPLHLIKVAPKSLHSLQWIIETAGYNLNGPMGAVKLKGFGIMYIGVLSDWLQDESADLSKTMSSLDQLIQRVEPYLD